MAAQVVRQTCWVLQASGKLTRQKKEFSASEMQDLLKYLNDQFYQFR